MGKNVLILKDIRKTYKKQKVLLGVDMTFEEGRIYGLLGPNGVGKTTLIRIISGLSLADSGDIIFSENEKEAKANDIHNKIGCIIEKPYFDESLNALDNMRIVGLLKGIEDDDLFRKYLKLVGLEDDKKKVKNYSLGMKQRLGIAQLLIGNPRIMFLDEPMNGLDPMGVIQLRDILVDMAKNKKITIILTSHILSELQKVCDAYYFMKDGRIVKYIDVLSNEEQLNLEQEYIKYIM